MDFPVEATVDLTNFPNKTVVREILSNHDFELRNVSGNQVRVKGSFLKLKAVKAALEPLLDSQTKTAITPVQEASSGAIPKQHTNNSSGGTRGWSGSRNKSPHASPSSPMTSTSWASGSSNSHPNSPEYGVSFSPRADQHGSFRSGRESFIVDADVFMYAIRLWKKDIDVILDSHSVKLEWSQVGDSSNISLFGKSARTAAGKLQSLLGDLNNSLRTQEVPLKDMSHEGQVLLDRIQKNKDIHNSVLVCAMNDKLHLIGPSGESYELKQKLLESPVDQLGRPGRTRDKNPSSLPPNRQKRTDRDSGAFASPSPGGAAGYSPSKSTHRDSGGFESPSPGGAAGYSPSKSTHRDSGGLASPSPGGAAGYSPLKDQDSHQPKRRTFSLLHPFRCFKKRSQPSVGRGTDMMSKPPKSHKKKGVRKILTSLRKKKKGGE